MERSSIELIIFDLGNVILPFNHYQIAEKLSRFSINHEEPKEIFSFLFDIEKGAVNPYETGKISTLEFFESIKRSLKLSISFDEFKPIWNDIFWEDNGVSKIIYALKGKKRLFLLSNTNPLHFDYILSRFPIIRVFDRWILSYEVGFKKPAIEIFETAMKYSLTEPQNIIFIDDVKSHVDVASSLGMKAIHFESANQLRKELKNCIPDISF